MTHNFDNFIPLNDRILVKRLIDSEKTSGGLFIPETAKDKPQIGLVLKVGSGKRDVAGNFIPLQVALGQKVYFIHYAGTSVNEELVILKEDDILGIL